MKRTLTVLTAALFAAALAAPAFAQEPAGGASPAAAEGGSTTTTTTTTEAPAKKHHHKHHKKAEAKPVPPVKLEPPERLVLPVRLVLPAQLVRRARLALPPIRSRFLSRPNHKDARRDKRRAFLFFSSPVDRTKPCSSLDIGPHRECRETVNRLYLSKRRVSALGMRLAP